MALGRRRWLACATALAFIAIAGAREAAAQNEAVGPNEGVAAQLDYVAAAGCPAAAEFEAVVAGRLGYSPFRADAAERVVIRIAGSGAVLEGRLEWLSATGARVGDRTFPSRSRDCGELVRAMGFALALQVQLMTATVPGPESVRPPPPAPAPPVEKAPPTATAPAAPPAPKGQPAEAAGYLSRPSLAAGAGAFGGVGLSPNAAAFGRLYATISWRRSAVELSADASAPSTLHRADGTGFSEQVLSAGLAGCGLSNRWSACVLAKMGDVRVVGQGVKFPMTSSGLLVQTGLRLGASQRLGPDGYIAAHVDGLVLLTRGVVTLDALPAWETPRVAALAGLDVGLRFW